MFLEKNGLQHGEFPLQSGLGPVQGLAWNCDGSVLAVWGEGKLELFTVSNYKWSLAQVILLLKSCSRLSQ